ncbi:MAG: DNA methyltransferase [Desulfobulbaceae bacterium]|nr:DNA methyltransferase [Desulfobulbaceae bacterium]
MSPKQVEDLKKSLKKFSLVEIPVIDADNRLLAGHQRIMVLKLLGREDEDIEVRMPNRKLTKREYDQYLLTSNRVHGDWDWEKLAANFDIDVLLSSGFDNTDLSHLFDDLEVEDDDFDTEKELAKIGKPKSKLGDLYQLGSHRLICADCTDLKAVKKLMDGKRVNAILQDPPYNIGLSYDKGIGGKKRYGGNVDDSKTDDQYRELLNIALKNGLAVCQPDAHVFTYCDQRYIWLLQTLYKELGIQNKRVCLWIKNSSNPTPQVAFNKQYEPCIYGTIGSPYLSDKVLNLSEIMNKEVGTGNRTIEDIHDMIDIWLVKRLNGTDYEHPTQKPPQLHEKAIRRCTKPGDTVLDLFAGSGSLMVACEQLKRSAYLAEREPIFVDLILRRYEKLTKQATKKLN